LEAFRYVRSRGWASTPASLLRGKGVLSEEQFSEEQFPGERTTTSCVYKSETSARSWDAEEYNMVETNVLLVNGKHVFICPWTGATRPHRYGFPVFKGDELAYVEGSYMTPGCALRDLERLVAENKISEKKAKAMARSFADYLDPETSAMMVQRGTLSEMIESSGIPLPGHFSELRLFGGRTGEREWAIKYNDSDSMLYNKFLQGEDLLPPKCLPKRKEKKVVPTPNPFSPSSMEAVVPPHSVWMEGKREKKMKEKEGERSSLLLEPEGKGEKRGRDEEESGSPAKRAKPSRPTITIPKALFYS
jgi:hypothetical protein